MGRPCLVTVAEKLRGVEIDGREHLDRTGEIENEHDTNTDNRIDANTNQKKAEANMSWLVVRARASLCQDVGKGVAGMASRAKLRV